MAAIAQVVPVVPVPLIAAALLERPLSRDDLTAGVQRLLVRLQAVGAVTKLAPDGLGATIDEGLGPLMARGLIDANLRPMPEAEAILAFYSASILQRLGKV